MAPPPAVPPARGPRSNFHDLDGDALDRVGRHARWASDSAADAHLDDEADAVFARRACAGKPWLFAELSHYRALHLPREGEVAHFARYLTTEPTSCSICSAVTW